MQLNNLRLDSTNYLKTSIENHLNSNKSTVLQNTNQTEKIIS